ncbi:ATP-grasp domain protein [Leptospira interrogans serovar Icterohaemorrhagiae str. Verdun HP]|uniref:ATP-grasp domain protein n=1 Tax=Leptospira interrogans serovar Icterohaemorrhagiae str. Verdun HP TaxID=1049910 RepID=M6RPY7_LEPIR|nr:ATP-grasp domain protein [Leptospira interrogans serovar Icterohaemorrhagiae str. Verdun HP]
MKIHEYQAKEILRRHKANVPFGVVIDKKKTLPKPMTKLPLKQVVPS